MSIHIITYCIFADANGIISAVLFRS